METLHIREKGHCHAEDTRDRQDATSLDSVPCSLAKIGTFNRCVKNRLQIVNRL